MEIKLRRKVSVDTFEAIMKIGRENKDFNFYIPILELADENREISHRVINTEILFKDPENAMGKNLLEKLKNYDFIRWKFKGKDIAYDLTPTGEEVVKSLKAENVNLIEAVLRGVLRRIGFIEKISFFGDYVLTEEGKQFIELKWPANSDSLDPYIRDQLITVNILKKVEITNNSRYSLTTTGEHAIKNGKVKIPEMGSFKIHTTSDPLFSEQIIGYEELEENAHEEYKKIKSRSRNGEAGGNGANPINPAWVKEYSRRSEKEPVVIKLAATENEEIDIHSIDNRVVKVPTITNVFATLQISDKTTSASLKIKADQRKEVDVDHNFDLQFIEVLTELIKTREEVAEIVDGRTVLLVSYEMLKPAEKNSFSMSLKIKEPEIGKYGSFEDVLIENIVILPKTEKDAVKWAKWLLVNRISNYLSEEEYETIKFECAGKFDDLYNPTEIMERLPTFDEIIREFAEKRTENPEKYWFVTIPRFLTERRGTYGN